jgi:hypothetical protein
MRKMLLTLTVRQVEDIDTNSNIIGISKSEYVRRILDAYIDNKKKEEETQSK